MSEPTQIESLLSSLRGLATNVGYCRCGGRPVMHVSEAWLWGVCLECLTFWPVSRTSAVSGSMGSFAASVLSRGERIQPRFPFLAGDQFGLFTAAELFEKLSKLCDDLRTIGNHKIASHSRVN